MPNQRPDVTPLLRRSVRLVLGSLLAFSVMTAHALDPRVGLADYNHTSWTAKSGAPSNITTMAQTTDGWLWLGTTSGLYRFDGVRFSRYGGAGIELPNGGVSTLYATTHGDLLVGYLMGGIVQLRGATVTRLASPADVPASYQLAVDTDGSIWAATVKGMLRYHGGRWTAYGREQGFPGPVADAVTLDGYGRLWASSKDTGLYLLDRDHGRFVATGMPDSGNPVVPAPDGVMWLIRDGRWQALPMPGPTATLAVGTMRAPTSASGGIVDRDGNRWTLMCPTGLCRTTPGSLQAHAPFDAAALATDRLDRAWDLSDLTTQTMLEDREGNIWVATRTGLERFRHNRLAPIPLPPGERWFQVVAAPDGAPLVASTGSGLRFEAGSTSFGRQRPPALFAGTGDGSLLCASDGRITRTRGGVVSTIDYPPGPDGKPLKGLAIRLTGSGDDIWLGLSGHGLFHYHAGAWIPSRDYGAPKGVTSIEADAPNAAWFGFRDGTVMRFRDGALSAVEGNAGIGPIALIDAQRGVVVAGTDGLAVVDGGRIRRLDASDPELLAGITGHIVDPNGDRWFNGRKGVVHVAASAWKAALDGAGQVQATLYDGTEGYSGTALSYNGFPTATRTRDGRLWFASQAGVVYLDPSRVHHNEVAPTMVIEPPSIQGASRDSRGRYILPAGTTSLRFEYTALSYTNPERVRFRYRLDGVDPDWQDAGSRRSTFYSGLGPGTYRFRVSATNEDGVPALAPAQVDLVIRPTMVQTTWFRLLCAVSAIGLLALAYRWRTRRLAQRLNERFQERLAERERISRTLHDTLLQNMQALILRLHVAVKPMERSSEARGRLDAILDQADTVMTEAREEIKGLRGSGDGGHADIGQALAAFGAALQAQFGAEFKLFVGGTARPLQDVAWQEIYYIAREALFNAYQHAHARKIEVELTYGTNEFGLVVRDDGRGIDDDIQQRGGRDGHWGLPGMKERAAALGGTLEWWSRDGLGTEVIARFPAARLYVPEEKPRWRCGLRGLLGRTGR
ncbi:two-component regulator propeller domain-containing protein [Massilia sp. TN1-12]|uniref:two-component regulator propeller domain-containing protein n=1 Tax=Massilia paldalensis TaxID=3377675 RepID=UPI00384B61A3